MKKHKWISVTITMILAGSLCFAMPQTVAEVVPNHSSPYSISEDESLSKAERYFGWTDPNKRLKVEDLGYFKLYIDSKEMSFIGKSESFSQSAIYYDVDSNEPIVKINFSQNGAYVRELFDYFEKENTFEKESDCTTLTPFLAPKENRNMLHIYLEKEEVSLEEIVEIMLLIEPDITSWYSNTRLSSLDNYNYSNKFPSTNDDKLVKKDNFFMLCQRNNNSENTVKDYDLFVFLEEKVEKNISDFYDIFSNQIICSTKTNPILYFYPNIFSINNMDVDHMFRDVIDSNFYEYVRPLRQCIEVIDGVEYYNVGKLRKLYENLPQDKTVDYSKYLNQKPGSKDLEIDRQSDLPGDEAKSGSNGSYAELTIGSRGQEVLDMKGRFFELGYFRTTSFNDRFTDSTADTVKLFEKNNGLPVDGVADAMMLGVLFSASAVGK